MAVPLKSGFELDDDPATPRTDATVCFRDLIPHPTHPRIAGISTHEAHSWCASRRAVLALAWLIKRLDVSNLETTPQILDLIHDILRPSLSKEGYEKVNECILTNHFLGQLVNGTKGPQSAQLQFPAPSSLPLDSVSLSLGDTPSLDPTSALLCSFAGREW